MLLHALPSLAASLDDKLPVSLDSWGEEERRERLRSPSLAIFTPERPFYVYLPLSLTHPPLPLSLPPPAKNGTTEADKKEGEIGGRVGS